MNEEFLSQEELSSIRALRQKLQVLELQKYIAELEVKNAILQVYLKHKLTEKDTIEEATGKITRQE